MFKSIQFAAGAAKRLGVGCLVHWLRQMVGASTRLVPRCRVSKMVSKTLSSKTLFSAMVSFGIISLAISGCASARKKAAVDELGTGYEKITVARNTQTGSDSEVIKPEYITEIRKGSEVVTVLYLFTPKPGQQARVTEALTSEIRRTVGKIPGLVSFNLHQGKNGKQVVNYAQFESKSAYEAWRAGALLREQLEAVSPFLLKWEAEVHEVSYIQH